MSQVRVPFVGSDGGEPVRKGLTDRILTGEETYRTGIAFSDASGYLAAMIGPFGVCYLSLRAVRLCLFCDRSSSSSGTARGQDQISRQSGQTS